MTDTLLVVLGGDPAGILRRERAGRLRFDYDEMYQARPRPTPLSVSMPPRRRSHGDDVVTPWLWNLLPDNDAVLTRWARQFHVSASSSFSLLASQVGLDCAGAVQFVPPELLEQEVGQPGTVTWLTEEDVADRMRDLKADSTTWLGRSFSGQFSLAGAQAKMALLLRDGRWGVPHGAMATTHILKPAVAGFGDHDLNEHMCLAAARRAGLTAARTRIVRFGDQTAVVVDRYDRHVSGNLVTRIHQEDLCQALGVHPAVKYQNEGGPGPVQIVRMLRRAMPASLADKAVARFLDALAWNWLIAGTDAHAKNYSLLLGGDQVRLAPLYDVASALPYDTHERRLRLAMKIGGDYSVFPFRNNWGEAADDMGIDASFAIDRVRELANGVADAFAEVAAEPEVTSLGSKLPARLVDLIADRAKRCAGVLDHDPR